LINTFISNNFELLVVFFTLIACIILFYEIQYEQNLANRRRIEREEAEKCKKERTEKANIKGDNPMANTANTNNNDDKVYLDNDNLAEFKGQIVDIFEDYLTEKNTNIENPDKEDDDGAAIIYGEDYDVIGDEVEYGIQPYLNDANAELDIEGIVKNIMFAFDSLVKKCDPVITVRDGERESLIRQVKNTFKEWNVGYKTYYTSYRVDGRYHDTVKAYSIKNAIEEAERQFMEANLGDCEVVESYCNIVSNSDGDVVWDRA
jgi:hypothetical protein